ncbi:MAG TPA: HPr family phosphocarrier protein [Gemmatimonadales bacterium]|nr:HPr family phosphocarrier protein [Gemmatimonadales bacterium]
MIEREAIIVNSLGMHARPAAQVVTIASGYKAEIELEHDGESVNGKSIMGVMTLAAQCGATVRIRATGVDAEAAMAALLTLIANGFGEA